MIAWRRAGSSRSGRTAGSCRWPGRSRGGWPGPGRRRSAAARRRSGSAGPAATARRSAGRRRPARRWGSTASVVRSRIVSISCGGRELDQQLEEEPVELGLGERIGPLHLERVLGGQHEERRRQPVRRAGDGDRPLLHRLEQGRLGLGRGPVDLVGQHQVGEDRPALELEPADRPRASRASRWCRSSRPASGRA